MNMITATTTPTDIRYGYMHIIDMMNIFPQFFSRTLSFTIPSLLPILVIFSVWRETIMNRLRVISVIERRNKIQVIDDDAGIAITLGRCRL
jgi:hypothetical protein